MSLTDVDRAHLARCVELAAEALEAGDEPFGSLLVAADGTVLAEDRNRIAGGDATRHPEFELARWAAEHVAPADRPGATVYTSGEHCPMCAAAHGWAGLGRIVVATTTEQLQQWRREDSDDDADDDAAGSPVAPLPVSAVLPGAVVDGPAPQLADRVRSLHRRSRRG